MSSTGGSADEQRQMRAAVEAYFLTMGLMHIVECRRGLPSGAEAWACDGIPGRYERTPAWLDRAGIALWAFSDADTALEFKMRFG